MHVLPGKPGMPFAALVWNKENPLYSQILRFAELNVIWVLPKSQAVFLWTPAGPKLIGPLGAPVHTALEADRGAVRPPGAQW